LSLGIRLSGGVRLLCDFFFVTSNVSFM
jgi:hypothetical protein